MSSPRESTRPVVWRSTRRRWLFSGLAAAHLSLAVVAVGTARPEPIEADPPPADTRLPASAGSEVLPSAIVDFDVRYISADKVYLDGGRGGGLRPGDILTVERDGVLVARLVVESVAKNSSACHVLEGLDPSVISMDDRVFGIPSGTQALPENEPVISSAGTSSLGSIAVKDAADGTDSQGRTGKTRSRTRVRGSVSLVWQHHEDQDGNTTERPSTRFRLDAREIAGSPWYARVRATLRRIDRAPTSSRPDEWNDRVSAFYVGYDAAVVGFELGRIPYIAAGGVGRLDGALARFQVAPWLQVGLFGGGLPSSRTVVGSEAFQSDMTKYGLFAVHTAHPGGGWTSTQTVAASQWYEGSTEARRYLASSGNFRWDGGVYVSHTVEFDRAPGIDDLGVSLGDWTLSDLRLSVRYARASNWSASVSHDERSRRPESSTVEADTTGTSYGYRGTRASLSYTPVKGLSTRMMASIRKADSDTLSSRSLALGATLHRFPDRKSRLRVDAQFYRTRYADGWNPGLRLERVMTKSVTLGAGGGARSYTAVSSLEKRDNRWLRGDVSVATAARVRFRVEYEQVWGDDPDRRTILGDVSYSF